MVKADCAVHLEFGDGLLDSSTMSDRISTSAWADVSGQFGETLLNPDSAVPPQIITPAVRRFDVYRNNVTVGLVNALGANFPAIKNLLGTVYFEGLARDYARAHPPRSPLMFEFGSEFAEYLSKMPDLERYPYLADVARLESIWLQSYHAADAEPLAVERLAQMSPDDVPNLRLQKHPAAQVFLSAYAVATIMASNRGAKPQALDAFQPENILVVRPRLAVEVLTLSAADHMFMSSLFDGHIFADAAERAFNQSDDFDLARALQLALTAGAFTTIQE
jgi:hypothetical protein